MKRLVKGIGIVTLAALLIPPGAAQPLTPPAARRVVAYFAEWGIYQRNYPVASIPGEMLTHVNYAFATIKNGECAVFDAYAAVDKAYPGDTWDAGAKRGNFKQLTLLKKKHPHLKTLIAVGGWTQSGGFSDVALTDASRSKFAKSCVKFVVEHGFDGIDVDWEYPVGGGLESNKTRKEDKQNYTLLLAELRKELDARGAMDKTKYLLTIAAPAGPTTIANLEVDKIHAHLDWINLMTYDFHGGWSPATNFNAALFAPGDDPGTDETLRTKFNVDQAVKAYLAAGVPADKIVVGVPFYGRGWGGVADANRGLFQKPAATLPKGTWEAGVFDYKDLAKNYVGKMARHWHDTAKSPWLYDAKSKLMISYDDPESLKAKAEYVVANKLGGVMVWELSADDGSLLRTLHETLRKKP